MIEIKFRAKGQTDKKWHYGFLYRVCNAVAYIYENVMCTWICDSETAGQYTGLKDRNGKEIYEGDICEIYADVDDVFKIGFENGSFMAYTISGITVDHTLFEIMYHNYGIEVIGNIYENPKPLGGA